MAKKRILFVDDEPNVLQGIQRMLHSLRNEWEVKTAESGELALAILAASPFDVIVSDMRMPKMDGTQLLTEVMRQYPQIVRIVLSGQSDQETVFRSVGPTHQYLSKPCDAETLKKTVDRACALRDYLGNEALQRLTSQIKTLPSLPTLYMEIIRELQSPEPSIDKIGRIIAQDAGMTAKILQLVNSAFFGFYSNITSPARAVTILGLDKIRALVLSIHIFTQFEQNPLNQFDFTSLWQHNLNVGQCARLIFASYKPDKVQQEESFMAGLLHDTGKLVLMANLPEKYQQVMAQFQNEKKSIIENEYAVFSASHAEVGAYLLGLWGLPTPIIEAVAFHHAPMRCQSQSFLPLTAVHVANALVGRIMLRDYEGIATIDEPYIQLLGLQDKLPEWQEQCRNMIVKEEQA